MTRPGADAQEVIAPKYDRSLRLKSSNAGSSNNDTTWVDETNAPLISKEHASQNRQESVLNYIIQLAHSEEFRGFVDEIEREFPPFCLL